MLNDFIEITTFFKQKKFTELELQKLKKSIIDNYSDKKIVLEAFSLIDLYIVKYKLTEIDKSKNINKIHKNYNARNKEFICKKYKIKFIDIIKELIKQNLYISTGKNFTDNEILIISDILLKRKIDKKRSDINRNNIQKLLSQRLKVNICAGSHIKLKEINKLLKEKNILISQGNKFTDEEIEEVEKYVLHGNYIREKQKDFLLRNKKNICFKYNINLHDLNEIIIRHNVKISKGDYFSTLEYFVIKIFLQKINNKITKNKNRENRGKKNAIRKNKKGNKPYKIKNKSNKLLVNDKSKSKNSTSNLYYSSSNLESYSNYKFDSKLIYIRTK